MSDTTDERRQLVTRASIRGPYFAALFALNAGLLISALVLTAGPVTVLGVVPGVVGVLAFALHYRAAFHAIEDRGLVIEGDSVTGHGRRGTISVPIRAARFSKTGFWAFQWICLHDDGAGTRTGMIRGTGHLGSSSTWLRADIPVQPFVKRTSLRWDGDLSALSQLLKPSEPH